jgi:hypothetical protein
MKRWPFVSTDSRVAPAPTPQPEEDEPNDSPYCECDLEPTMQEEATRRCQSCGKEIIS